MVKRNFVVYADESDREGRYYSNFYGGVLLNANDQESVSRDLDRVKLSLNLGREVKWSRVSANYLEKYIEFMRYYFSLVRAGKLKVRIMFTQNIHVPVGLTSEQVDGQYFRLYYQFLKHAFGLRYANPGRSDSIFVAVLLDQLPDTRERSEAFKDYLSKIGESRMYQGRRVHFPRHQIADVDSKDHVILQGLDIILGAMNFRLNDRHKDKPPGQRRRGKRTVAKEQLYKHINGEIRTIYPNFNIGVSTAASNLQNRWLHPYRHWNFKPAQHHVDLSRGKKYTVLSPTCPTK